MKKQEIKKEEMKKIKIVHYCASSYFIGNCGGVPRFDYQISLVFPNRIFIKDGNIKELLTFLYKNKDAIVITDNQLSLEIPNDIKTIVVHHGCAKHNYLINKQGYFWFRKFVKPQEKMFYYRKKSTTIFLSIAEFTSQIFKQYYPIACSKHKIFKLLHPSEFNENLFKKNFNEKPVILGNWRGIKKGEKIIDNLIKNIESYKFKQLNICIRKPYSEKDILFFNVKKQELYLDSDIFLNISNSEGNAYAIIDAMICGLPIVTTKVGLFFNDVPSDCFVELDLKQIKNPKYVEERINYAWQNRYTLSSKIREYYINNCNFYNWSEKLKNLLKEFNNKNVNFENKFIRTLKYMLLFFKILIYKNISKINYLIIKIKNLIFNKMKSIKLILLKLKLFLYKIF